MRDATSDQNLDDKIIMGRGFWCIILFQLSYCSDQIKEFLTDPAILCQGQKTTLTCNLKRASLIWKYSDQVIGLPISNTHQTYTITIGLLGFFFDKSVYSNDEGYLQSSLSFAASQDMNRTKVTCEGPGISFIRTLHIIAQGKLPDIVFPQVLNLTPGLSTYTTLLRWDITIGSKLPTVHVEPTLSNNSRRIISQSYSGLSINITTLYSVRYLINISAQNCNGKTSKKFELYKVGYCDQPPHPPVNGGIDPIKDKYLQGEVVHYYCSREHKKFRQTKCTLDGTWIPDPSVVNCKNTDTKKWFIALVAALGPLSVIFVVSTIVLIAIYCAKRKYTSQENSPSIPRSRATSRQSQNMEHSNRNVLVPQQDSIPKLQVESPSVIPGSTSVLEETYQADNQKNLSSEQQVDADPLFDDQQLTQTDQLTLSNEDKMLHLTTKEMSKEIVQDEVMPLEIMSIENDVNEQPENIEVSAATLDSQKNNLQKETEEEQMTQQSAAEEGNVQQATEESAQDPQQPVAEDSMASNQQTETAQTLQTTLNAQSANREPHVDHSGLKIEVKVHTESGATILAETLPAIKEERSDEQGSQLDRKSIVSQNTQTSQGNLRGVKKPDDDIHKSSSLKIGRDQSQEDNAEPQHDKFTSISHSNKRDNEQADTSLEKNNQEEMKGEKGDDTEIPDSSTHRELAHKKASKEREVTPSKSLKRTKSGSKRHHEIKGAKTTTEKLSGREDISTGQEDSDISSKKISPKGKRMKRKGLAQESNLLSSEASGSASMMAKKNSGKLSGRSLHGAEKESIAPSPPRTADLHQDSTQTEHANKVSNPKIYKTKKTKSPIKNN